jgi:hypothetical protein
MIQTGFWHGYCFFIEIADSANLRAGSERAMVIKKIISGGQTGVDQAALDVAIEQHIPHGGWTPKGRETEGGPLPEAYHLQEVPGSIYPWDNGKMNILDSDGTLIISRGELKGGSAWTRELAQRQGRPYIHVDLNQTNTFDAAGAIISWIVENGIEVLNVAGPRASKDVTIYQSAMDVLRSVLYLDIIQNNHRTYFDPKSESGPQSDVLK